jgi:hypothetical protein
MNNCFAIIWSRGIRLKPLANQLRFYAPYMEALSRDFTCQSGHCTDQLPWLV